MPFSQPGKPISLCSMASRHLRELTLEYIRRLLENAKKL